MIGAGKDRKAVKTYPAKTINGITARALMEVRKHHKAEQNYF